MADRDRNALGAPENARPRDRTGRPLPYDTDRTDLAEDFDVGTVEEALAAGRWLWDEHRYFEAHECLEHVWHHAPPDDRAFWQGVIQVAVACVHHQRGNARGVAATCRKARSNLDGYPSVHHGIDVDQLRTFCDGVADVMDRAGASVERRSEPRVERRSEPRVERGSEPRVERGSEPPLVEIGYPELPTMDDGPWFTEQARATPLSREPAWQVAARARRVEAGTQPPAPDDPRPGPTT